MNFDDIYDDPAMQLGETVDLRCVVAAMKLMNAGFGKPMKGADPKSHALIEKKYVDWFLSDVNKMEKDIAMMLLFEEAILERDLEDILLPDEKRIRLERNTRSLDEVWKIIDRRMAKK